MEGEQAAFWKPKSLDIVEYSRSSIMDGTPLTTSGEIHPAIPPQGIDHLKTTHPQPGRKKGDAIYLIHCIQRGPGLGSHPNSQLAACAPSW